MRCVLHIIKCIFMTCFKTQYTVIMMEYSHAPYSIHPPGKMSELPGRVLTRSIDFNIISASPSNICPIYRHDKMHAHVKDIVRECICIIVEIIMSHIC